MASLVVTQGSVKSEELKALIAQKDAAKAARNVADFKVLAKMVTERTEAETKLETLKAALDAAFEAEDMEKLSSIEKEIQAAEDAIAVLPKTIEAKTAAEAAAENAAAEKAKAAADKAAAEKAAAEKAAADKAAAERAKAAAEKAAAEQKAAALAKMEEVYNESNGDNLLMVSCGRFGAAAEVQRFLDAGCNPNFRNKDSETPLMRAANNNRPDIIMLLLAAGARKNVKNMYGMDAFQLARDKPECQRLLEASPAEIKAQLDKVINIEGETLLIRQVRESLRNYANPLVERILAQGADPNKFDNNGNTALLACAYTGNDSLARLLCKHKANVDKQNLKGETALIKAAMCNNLAVVDVLISFGARKELKDKKGMSALDYAHQYGHHGIQRSLT
eukprot:CAMPEP_0172652280 /NCGR_PEP_ID=MMETSP1068-20121228/243237_1 /TAXON_ID=35684 /ORGANISM="Pseudopedinella elastica, Strain CCMP716" /LENGTH=391 /DNA_ID=CAMNT_0013466687 /DNA_START=334 /DNA_END=1509 /DNA_ORIENTATION=-